MKKEPFSPRDIKGQLVVLGTGTSVGVPALGCGCDVCRSDHPGNKRTRCSVILGLPEGNLLIDTAPDMRQQLLRERIGIVHAVAYTHEHADHIFGLDDLRLFPFYLGHAVPLYCEDFVAQRLTTSFDYAFSTIEQTHPGAIPQLDLRPISLEPIEVLGSQLIPLRLFHGPRFKVLGFRFGNVAYCTDTNQIPDESLDKLRDLDVLIIDGLRHEPHPTHFSVDESLEVIEKLRPRKAYLTHCSCKLDYEKTNAYLPEHVKMAHDGLVIPLT